MEINSEIYSLDISKDGSLISYGGKDDKFIIASFPSLTILNEVCDFQDSIIFVKFILHNVLLTATLDGTISLYIIEEEGIKEVDNRDLEEDISFIEYQNNFLIIGTVNGSIHVFNQGLEDENMFVGHNSEIVCIKIGYDCLYTLSKNKYIIFNFETQDLFSKRMLCDFITVEPLEKNMSLVSALDQSILVKDNDSVLQRYNFGAECILRIGDDLICGGAGFSLNIISLKNTQNDYNCKFMAENIEGISKIVKVGDNIIAFSTFCGKVAIGDYREGKSFIFYEANVGVIYDMKFYQRYVAVCGSEGINIIHL